MAEKRSRDRFQSQDGCVRGTFIEPRKQARVTARAFLDRRLAAAYMPQVEVWWELPDGEIEFTMRRLRSAARAQIQRDAPGGGLYFIHAQHALSARNRQPSLQRCASFSMKKEETVDYCAEKDCDAKGAKQ